MHFKKKAIIAAVVFTFLLATTVWFKVFYLGSLPRNIEEEAGIKVTAIQLVSDFKTNEPAAYKKYTDDKDGKKAVEVTGVVQNVNLSEDTLVCISLKSNDPFTDVFVTLKKGETTQPNIGNTCTIKGVCTGILTSVSIQDAILIK